MHITITASKNSSHTIYLPNAWWFSFCPLKFAYCFLPFCAITHTHRILSFIISYRRWTLPIARANTVISIATHAISKLIESYDDYEWWNYRDKGSHFIALQAEFVLVCTFNDITIINSFRYLFYCTDWNLESELKGELIIINSILSTV